MSCDAEFTEASVSDGITLDRLRMTKFKKYETESGTTATDEKRVLLFKI